ncbi:hypothetical protein ACFL35_19360, partial [Candidatus Riflebacteria bacterium]
MKNATLLPGSPGQDDNCNKTKDTVEKIISVSKEEEINKLLEKTSKKNITYKPDESEQQRLDRLRKKIDVSSQDVDEVEILHVLDKNAPQVSSKAGIKPDSEKPALHAQKQKMETRESSSKKRKART